MPENRNIPPRTRLSHYLRTGILLDNTLIGGYTATHYDTKAQHYVRPAPEIKRRLKYARTYREKPADIYLSRGHGYSVISVRMTSLGNSIGGTRRVPFSNAKIPRIGGNGIHIKFRGFGGNYDREKGYKLNPATPEIRFFEIHPANAGVIMIQGLTYAPIEVDVHGYNYFPHHNMD